MRKGKKQKKKGCHYLRGIMWYYSQAGVSEEANYEPCLYVSFSVKEEELCDPLVWPNLLGRKACVQSLLRPEDCPCLPVAGGRKGRRPLRP